MLFDMSFSSWKEVVVKSLLISLFFFVANLIREWLGLGTKFILPGFRDGLAIFYFLYSYLVFFSFATIYYLLQRRKEKSSKELD